MQAEVVTKGEFATLIGVTPGRVSQMLKSGDIGPDALEGEGRMARIRVATAKAHLRDRLDISQRLGNGLGTRLDDDGHTADLMAQVAPVSTGAVADGGTPPPPPSVEDSVEAKIKREKLREVQYRNRRAAEDEEMRKGTLVPAADASAMAAGAAAKTLQLFEGAASDIASAMAARFKLPQRDVLHLLRAEFRRVRERGAAQQAARRDDLPETTETVIEADG
ncbi:hypothetical protein [Breoghania sp.]|uniref:hypothetical protein n=1 Tax=Breoghania sp. TaxID=2065378 RepID=UPI002AAC039A|nr:hypothetical protein [Breoghania sp.]